MSYAQDLHFTNYDYAPVYFNPAQTGSFLGSIRATVVARDQFSSFITTPWRTGMLGVDAPLAFGFRKQDWIGVGMSLFQDQVGDLSYKTGGVNFSLAYHLGLDKKQNKYLTLGLQQGFFQRQLDVNRIRSEDQISSLSGGGTSDQSIFNDFNDNGSGSDFGAGIQYTAKIDKTNLFNIGIALSHIRPFDNGAMNTGSSSSENLAPSRFNFHGSYYNEVSKKLDFEYALFFSRAANVNNIMPQVRSYFKLKKMEKVDGKRVTHDKGKLMLGLGYRVNDALLLLTGYEIKGWQFGFSYDLTISSASNYNNYYGAIEIGAKRIFNIYKQPEVDPIILCPKF